MVFNMYMKFHCFGILKKDKRFSYNITVFFITNMSNLRFQDRGNAQVSCAGLFIGSHIGFDYPGVWLHIDMAAPAHVVCITALCLQL